MTSKSNELSVSDGPTTEIERCETAVFVEHDQALQCIRAIVSSSQNNEALCQLRQILDKYLELPSLLDHHLESMVSELSDGARKVMETQGKEKLATSQLPVILSALYSLSKVRGRKRIQKFLPHQVRDMEPVLETLTIFVEMHRQAKSTQSESTTEGAPQLWESVYTLWNWTGALSLIPFDCSVIVDNKQISNLINLAKENLKEAGPTREVAASCLASWLSRPDLETTELLIFIEWSADVFKKFDTASSCTFQLMGILQTLVAILKTSTVDRETLLQLMDPLWPIIMGVSESKPSNLLLRKLLTKWWTRMGSAQLPPRVAPWRYRHQRRSMQDNLREAQNTAMESIDDPGNEQQSKNIQGDFFLVPDQAEDAMGEVIKSLTDPSTSVRWSAAKGIGRITERLPAICAEDVLDGLIELFEDKEKDNNWHGACLALAELARRGLLLPHRLPEVIPKIVSAIHYDLPRRQTSVGAHVRDAGCYTYWALARAYSPSVLKPFVAQLSRSIVLAFLFDREVNCRRAASAAFQEFVGRLGARNFEHGISILTTADFFSLGNRRDAYTSIAVNIAQFPEYRRPIIDHLYQIKLSHWDIAMRSLSAESLGLLTPMEKGYVESAVVPYLLENCLDMRDVQLRHGCVLGLAEIVLAYGNSISKGESLESVLSGSTVKSVAEIVPVIEKKRLYRGKGGEQMRAAVCRLIECISLARVPLTVPQQVRLLDSIDACLPHPNEDVSLQAGKALHALTRSYFPVSSSGPSDRLQKRVVDKYVQEVKTSINPAATRGFTMALGCLPAKLLAPSLKVLDQSLACLCRSSRPDATVGQEKDAETRRNALLALTHISETVGIIPRSEGNLCVVGLSEKQVGHLLTAFLLGLGDYSMDRRGDIGSICRKVAMGGLETLAILSSRERTATSPSFFTTETYTRLIGGLVKQFAEKLDVVRAHAGCCLVRILTIDPPISEIPDRARLLEAIKPEKDAEIPSETTNWSDPSVTFPMVIKILDIDCYFDYVIEGLVISVGSLTKNVSSQSSAVLIQWIKNAQTVDVKRFGNALLRIFKQHQFEGRVTLPLLKTISLLVNRRWVNELIKDDSFSLSLLCLVAVEESKCKDIHRLTEIIHVSLGFVSDLSSRKGNLAFVCKMLIHPFPRVRRLAAENLYVRLVEESAVEDESVGLSALLSFPWDGEEHNMDDIRKMAEKVAESFGISEEELWTSVPYPPNP